MKPSFTGSAKPLFAICLSLLITATLSACSSDNDDDPNPSPTPSLDGNWYGRLQQTVNGPVGINTSVTLSLTISGTTGVATVAGTPINFTLQLLQNDVYGVVLDDGFNTEAGFILDSSKTHMAILTEDRDFGVAEKAATPPTGYTGTLADLNGNWSGNAAELDNLFNLTSVYTSNANIDGSDGSFTGTDSTGKSFANDTAGEFSITDANYRIYQASYTATTPTDSGAVLSMLSFDKQYIASMVCSTSLAASFSDCAFFGWNKQP